MLGYLIQVPTATKFIVLCQLIFGTYTSHRHQKLLSILRMGEVSV